MKVRGGLTLCLTHVNIFVRLRSRLLPFVSHQRMMPSTLNCVCCLGHVALEASVRPESTCLKILILSFPLGFVNQTQVSLNLHPSPVTNVHHPSRLALPQKSYPPIDRPSAKLHFCQISHTPSFSISSQPNRPFPPMAPPPPPPPPSPPPAPSSRAKAAPPWSSPSTPP